MNSMERQKDRTLYDEHPKLKGVQYATAQEQRVIATGSNKNEVTGPRQEQCSAVDVSGGESQVRCC